MRPILKCIESAAMERHPRNKKSGRFLVGSETNPADTLARSR